MSTVRRRTVFDLLPLELKELYRLNLNVSATVPPRRPSRSSSEDYNDYAYDEGIYERYREMHDRAKAERSLWLRTHRITRAVMLDAARVDYDPYAQATRLGLTAPPVPDGYTEALRAWREPPPPPVPLSVPMANKSFSF
jgi:hypothetical protein